MDGDFTPDNPSSVSTVIVTAEEPVPILSILFFRVGGNQPY
jgi:hypothetical protein